MVVRILRKLSRIFTLSQKAKISWLFLCYFITNSWEQRKLSEIASYQPSNLSASNTDINGRFDLYDANGVIGKTNAMPQKESYITIIKDGSGVGRVRMLPPQTCYIGTMGGIFSKATNNIDFIFHTLSNFDFSTHIIGATIPHVYFSDYGNDEIGVPYEAEQKMIGKFFSNLDNLITLHQRKQINFFKEKLKC